jgi:hypothetical protein
MKKGLTGDLMRKIKLLEAIADIAYIAGYHKYSSGDSRLDASLFLAWANEFEKLHKITDWEQADYISLIEEFTENKIITEQESIAAFC